MRESRPNSFSVSDARSRSAHKLRTATNSLLQKILAASPYSSIFCPDARYPRARKPLAMRILPRTTKKILRYTPDFTRLPCLAFERFAIPLTAFGSGDVGALKEVHQRCFRICVGADVVVHQQEFFHLRMIESCRGTNRLRREAVRLRCGVRIECGPFDVSAAGPESHAAHLMRVSLASNRIGSSALRRSAAREASHGQIETSPEEMHGTNFSDEPSAELFEHLIDPHQDAPELVHGIGIIGGMNAVLLKRNWIGNLAGRCPNLGIDAEF